MDTDIDPKISCNDILRKINESDGYENKNIQCIHIQQNIQCIHIFHCIGELLMIVAMLIRQSREWRFVVILHWNWKPEAINCRHWIPCLLLRALSFSLPHPD